MKFASMDAIRLSTLSSTCTFQLHPKVSGSQESGWSHMVLHTLFLISKKAIHLQRKIGANLDYSQEKTWILHTLNQLLSRTSCIEFLINPPRLAIWCLFGPWMVSGYLLSLYRLNLFSLQHMHSVCDISPCYALHQDYVAHPSENTTNISTTAAASK